jgi:tRNA 2-thiocytidine biosynthesis protein TtcA
MAYWEKEIRSLMGKAIHRYGMVQDGDRILVGVSGGKDSLSLLYLLHERKKRVPISYELVPVHVDIGYDLEGSDPLRSFFEERGLTYRIEKTDIGRLAHSPENRENPCFLCSWERRKLIFRLADELKCNKIAFGHHKDDIIETFLINIFFSAQISTMLPVQSPFKGKMTIIRPLSLLEEVQLERFAREMNLPILAGRCPSSGKTKRGEIKTVIQTLARKDRRIKGNIFRSLSNVNLDYLFVNPKKPSGNPGVPG